MSRFLKILAFLVAGLVALILAIQLVPYGRGHTNPAVLAEPAWDAPETRKLFMRACGDCHSNETTWPWYTNIAPVSWSIQQHVDEGREKFNISEWSRVENESEEAAELFKEGKMPLKQYLLMHPEAKLSNDETSYFIQGLINTFGSGEGGEAEEDD